MEDAHGREKPFMSWQSASKGRQEVSLQQDAAFKDIPLVVMYFFQPGLASNNLSSMSSPVDSPNGILMIQLPASDWVCQLEMMPSTHERLGWRGGLTYEL